MGCKVVGLKNTITGDTLASEKDPVILERMEFPEPVISVAVEPKTKADQEKMGIALGKLAEEDPSFRVNTDEETGQTIISGMGELHLEIMVDRMKREFNVEVNVGKPHKPPAKNHHTNPDQDEYNSTPNQNSHPQAHQNSHYSKTQNPDHPNFHPN